MHCVIKITVNHPWKINTIILTQNTGAFLRVQCCDFFILHLHLSSVSVYYFTASLSHVSLSTRLLLGRFLELYGWLEIIKGLYITLYSRFFGSEFCIRAAEHQCFFKETENEKLFVDLKKVPETFIFKSEGSRVRRSDEGSARRFYATGTSYSPLGLSWLCIMTKQLVALWLWFTLLTITISGSPHRCDCLEAGDQSFLLLPLIWLSISVSNSS